MTYTGSYPLDWPEGWKRTAWRERSRFKIVSLTHSIGQLELELDRLNAKDAVISSDARTDRYGRIIGQQRKPDDPGVAVYFRYGSGNHVIAADLYSSLPENIKAVTSIIESIRTLDRRGIDNVVGRVLQGFVALPASSATGLVISPWHTLGVDRDASRSTVRAKYLELVQRHHPDKGGDPEKFHEIQNAYAAILEVMAS